MQMRVLLVQNDVDSIGVLSRFFIERGDEVWQTQKIGEALTLTDLVCPDLLVLDLHFPGNDWLDVLRQARAVNPDVRVIITNRKPDVQRELLAQSQGARVFLRQPFTRQWLERAVLRVEKQAEPPEEDGPPEPVRFPLALKIFWPHALLILLVALTAAFFVDRYLRENSQSRVETAALARRDALQHLAVKEEQTLVLAASSLAAADGLAEAVWAADPAALARALPVLPPGDYEAVDVLDVNGATLLSLHKLPWREPVQFETIEGSRAVVDAVFVRMLLQGRQAEPGQALSGLVHAPWGDFYYAGLPVFYEGSLQGVLLVGKSLYTLRDQLTNALGSGLVLYDTGGRPMISTLAGGDTSLTMPYSQVRNVVAGSQPGSQGRVIIDAGQRYLELFVPWVSAEGEALGLFGVLQPYEMGLQPEPVFLAWAGAALAACILLAYLAAWLIAHNFRQAIARVGRAAEVISQGNLEIKLKGERGDELDSLARQMNTLVSGVQERLLEHDLLGISYAFEPETPLNVMSIRNLHLEGKQTLITVVRIQPMCFNELLQQHGPKVAFDALNWLYQALMEVAVQSEDVVTHFDGEAALLYYGLFPGSDDPAQSALQACRAVNKMRSVMPETNAARTERGLPEVHFSAVLDSRVLAAGVVLVRDRMHYAVTGEGVTALRWMHAWQEDQPKTSILVGQPVIDLMGEQKAEFEFAPVQPGDDGGNAFPYPFYRMA